MNHTPARFRRRPAGIEAVQWTDANDEQLRAFAGQRFDTIAPEDRVDDPDATASLIESAHESWALLVPGDWVVKRGDDFAVLTPEEFADLYQPVTDQPVATVEVQSAIHAAIETLQGGYHHLPSKTRQRVEEVVADAILALPGTQATADCAAVLREAADALHAKGEPTCPEAGGDCCWYDAVAELRRMADRAGEGGHA